MSKEDLPDGTNSATDLHGSVPVPEGQRFDESRLAQWLADNVDGYRGPLRVEQFEGGQSNPTFKLQTPQASYVMRRKPMGALLSSAHAVDREYRVMTALGTTGFPVPRTLALCTDDSVIGSWFYVMECVTGRIFWDTSFPEVPTAERAAYFEAMNETMARMHSFDPAAIDLGDYGRPENYVARQVSRFTKQYLADPEAGRSAFMDRLIDWLPAHLPIEDSRAIVHGDYKSNNMIFHPTEPRVIAVIDWELSTIGNPLADFAFHAMIYRAPPELGGSLVGLDLAALNIPSEGEYVAAYCRRTGRAGIPDLGYYMAFNMFRLAAIIHGIRGRMLRGTASSAHAHVHAAKFEVLAEAAWRQAERWQVERS